jgi:hypothetical protein
MTCPVCPCSTCAAARWTAPYGGDAGYQTIPYTAPTYPTPPPPPGHWKCACGKTHPVGYSCVWMGRTNLGSGAGGEIHEGVTLT